jgi:TonB family protein
MIASWMLYTLLVGLLVSVSALAAERVARGLGKPVRFVWAAAVVASLLWPAVASLLPKAPAAEAPLAPGVVQLQPMMAVATQPARWDVALRADSALITVWLLIAAFLLFRLVRALYALRSRRASWRQATVDGIDVRLSDDVGPAVIGLRRMEVVLPEWILSLDEPLRSLVLRHEEEHRAARDPYLLFGGAVALALMPWNLALWWQTRRLRLAIETDCDARVLRADPRPERYGMLLLTIAQRRSTVATAFAPMLSEPTTNLERRILAMRANTRKLALGAALVCAAAITFACSLQSPDAMTAPKPSAPKQIQPGQNQVYFEFQVEKQVQPIPGNHAPRYPDMLRTANVEGEVLAQFVVDTLGRPDTATFKVLKSTHDLFTAAVKSNLADMKFNPAQVGGRPVKQLVQMPFQFNLSRGATVGAVTIPESGTATRRGPRPVVSTVKAPERHDSIEMKIDTAFERASTAKAQTYFEFQVVKAAKPVVGNPAPRYPDMLRAANIEGDVIAQFVVDTFGLADPATLKILKSQHDLFSQAVRDNLANMRFTPAVVGDRKVKQLLQMSFAFHATK